MNRVTRQRRAVRAAFTRALNKLNDVTEASQMDKIAVQVSFTVLEERAAELQELDTKIMDLMLEDDEADINSEMEGTEDYRRKFLDMKVKTSQIFSNYDYVGSVLSANHQSERKFKLPKLELRKFGGDLREWLPFWSQFQKIDQDVDIAPEDKFQYLIQSTTQGSRAREVVESFPPTAENYSRAVSSLKSRFGREDLLVEVYVREVLKLILSTHQSKESIIMSSLYDKLESYLRALETLGVTTEKCSAMLFPLIESCFPEEFLKAWHRSSCRGEMKDAKERLNNLMEFLKTEVEGEERITLALAGFGLESCEPKTSKLSVNKKSTHKFYSRENIPTAAGLLSTADIKEAKKTCIFCDKSHNSSDCFTAQGMSIAEKQKVLRQRGCCFSCLKPGHVTKKCRAVLRCCVCGKHHVTLMCEELKPHSDTAAKSDFENVALANFSHSPKVFLQTLRVKIASDCQESCVRALIDTGSQKSYILKGVAKEMKYVPQREEVIIHSLFGGVNTESSKHQCYQIRLGNLSSGFSCNFMVLDQPVICQGIPSIENGPWMAELKKKDISLTDVGNTDDPIAVLIGADVAGRLLTGRRHELASGLVAIETRLGWTLMGKAPQNEVNDSNIAMVVTSMFVKEADIPDLWKLDSIGITDVAEKKSRAEQEFSTKQHFMETVQINDQGRYEVSLPWLEGHPPLPDNKDLAMKRLQKTSKKLESDNLFQEYDNVLQQWLKEGIIEEIPMDELHNGYFLPHRPVVKESSSTTRIRPVFDASAKSHNNYSLNQCLDSGPNLIELIPDVLLRFREKRFGVIADIKKAFLQISLNKNDRNFLRFLWWDESRKVIKMYRHTRVVFGVTCSPFLLGAVIEYHIRRTSNLDDDGVQQLTRSFYVDNLVTSKDCKSDLQQFISETTELMAKGGFELRGWESSSEESEAPSPVLGITWDKRIDTLQLNLTWLSTVSLESVTKRTILSIAHRLYDPVGITSPVMLCPKILLQRTWQLGINWDVEVTDELREEFVKWFNELHILAEIKIPRWLGTTSENIRSCTIHTFCDASSKAYAAVTYLRVETDDAVTVRLLAARCRVAPLKDITIPRMELLAALIGTRLANSVIGGLQWSDTKMYFWSDSTTVLAWILREEKWSVFVRNRIQEIRTLSLPAMWGHIAGEENPADLPSRGCGAKQLVARKWWEGPEWMREPMETWPCSSPNCPIDDEEIVSKEKMKTTCLLNSTEHEQDWYYKRFSSFTKIVRLMAWILRFILNCRRPKLDREYGEITSQEFCNAEKKIVIQIQKESFSNENDEKLRTLDTFMDGDGIIKVRTKLIYRKDKTDFKLPMVLPSKHVVVRRLILSHHESNNHAGLGTLLNILRERYWILNCRKSVRSAISKCVVCQRYSSRRLETVPAPLPEPRVRDAAVFEVTGIDMAGPLFLKNNEKAWVCLFTCAVYRAVHLELVTTLSTESFLLALRRFVARRGRCSIIYTDNGTNFVGAAKQLKLLDWDRIVKHSTAHHIEWRFNPPTAAWWGGWWERIIRILKDLLKRVLGKACLNYEEMATTLCDCESIINSRPLTYISENDSELVPLSPSSFLQDVKEMGLADYDIIDHHSLNRRVKYRQSLQRDLRNRFRNEYLGQLIQRVKPKKNQLTVNVGDIVLIGSDSLKRLEWPLGRVTKIIPGRDGVVRVVKLQTVNGELTRPVQRLYPLEVSATDGLGKSFEERPLPSPSTNQDKEPGCVSDEVTRVEQKVLNYRTRDGRLIKVPERLNL